MDDADVAVSVDVGDSGGGRPGDGVIASHRERDDLATGDLVYVALDVVEALAHHPVRAVSVAVVDDLDVFEDLQPVAEVIGARLVGVGAQRPRPEASPGSVRGAEIEGRSDHGDIGLPRVELLR